MRRVIASSLVAGGKLSSGPSPRNLGTALPERIVAGQRIFPFHRVLGNPTRVEKESSPYVTEGMVNGPDDVYVEREGRMRR
jgi:hypothetical protein